jgi:glucose/arabinose dehydrogenase
VPSFVEALEGRVLLSSTSTSSLTTSSTENTGLVAAALAQPTVTATRPANGATNVAIDIFVAADVSLPNTGHGIDAATITTSTVKLFRTSDGKAVQAVVNTSGGGDAIALQPVSYLEKNTKYTFQVTSGLKDTAGASFKAFTSTFTTGDSEPVTSNIRFDKVTLSNATGHQFTAVTMGPDGNLYAADRLGYIIRYKVNADGTFESSKTFKTVQIANGATRLITGIVFDPSSTANNLILWVSHGYDALEASPDWSGKISKVSGPNLENYVDVIYNLPRSYRDHLTNQMVFGPDGALYFEQASMSAMGAADATWGNRNEHLLSAAILRVDTKAITSPLNVKTAEGGGRYNPWKSDAPVKIYASGVRNAYDLVWTRDGHLYAPVNGSAHGGNTPTSSAPFNPDPRIDYGTNGPYTGPAVKGTTNLPTQDDFLYDIQQNGYYGHPNPTRNEYVMNGGNPTSGVDPYEVTNYAVGTQPDRNYRGVAYDFGKNFSPDGVIEYQGSRFNGALDGTLLVVRYSGGDDIIALSRDKNGKITKAQTGIEGFTQFVDPLDLTEDKRNGNIYVAEYGGEKITLLRPNDAPLASGTRLTSSHEKMIFNDIRGGANSPTQTLVLRNKGDAPLTISSIVLSGDNADQFTIVSKPGTPVTLAGGTSINVVVAFKPGSSVSLSIKTANIRVKSNDTRHPVLDIPLRGLPTTGLEGENEPSLQKVLNLWQISVNDGDATPDEFKLALPLEAPTDEVVGQTLVRAAKGTPVTFTPIAVFAPAVTGTQATVGFYDVASGKRTDLFSVAQGYNQSVAPVITGTTSFDPGTATFGIYGIWPKYNNRISYSQDSKNTWDTGAAHGRMLRFYPLRNTDSTYVQNAYVIAFEGISSYSDQQDVVGIIRNVRLTNDTAKPRIPRPPVVTSTTGTITIDWPSSKDADLLGYNIYRSTSPTSGFVKLNPNIFVGSSYVDGTAPKGTVYYWITAVDESGNESGARLTSGARK